MNCPLGVLSAATALVFGTGGAQAQAFVDAKTALVDYSKADVPARKACPDMAQYKGKDIAEIHALPVQAASGTPTYCRISGVIQPEVAFEVSLPEKWNGRFYMIGNGGHAGEALDDRGRIAQRDEALKMGFAFAQTNTGHDSRKEPGGSFVMSNPQKAIDYAYRAVHVTAATAKDIVKNYYARPATRSYWNSCSNGGRQGLLEAQRYPDDFDGVLANAPWVSQTGFTIGTLWNQRALTVAPLSAAKLALLGERVMARCDAIDGVKDGLIDDPRKCDFDAHRDVPACTTGSDTPFCLTSAQADAVMKIYSGPMGNGKSLFPGFMPGSEAGVAGGFGNTGGPTSAWMGTIVPAQPGAKPADFNLGEGTMRYLVHTPPQPDYDTGRFDFDHDAHLLDAWAKKANATSTDLNAFRRRGGKLIMTYGWADQILQPLAGVNYYESLVQRYGTGTGDFARLFMVPGMTHCSGGNGTDRFDAVTALVNWVEKGKAPDTLAASRMVDSKTVRTRPLCPYPQVAKYPGQGSIDEAANFSCKAP
ncbi:MAG TPA: tannase/feruloyl esterase family alpha/beta hydrolase [Steroidobacteraceae bacterium]|nr:tannase/feruloyl esterase family alpha/beta hydrolase [Steroidobacteraceae bacterium]